MTIVTSPDDLDLGGVVLSIGNFDGVHLGHQQLLARMAAVARDAKAASVIVTFFPPARVLFGKAKFLSTSEEKLEQLNPFDPSAVVMTTFSYDFAQTPKDVFLESLTRLRPRTIIVGENFRFGRDRQGNLNDLSAIAGKLEVFGLWQHQGEAVSSTRIRELLANGAVDKANMLLGRRYQVSGRVVLGDRRGQTLGFPTANLEIPAGKALPKGVFAVEVVSPEGRHGGMANAGSRPTFPQAPPALEVHLFDYQGDLYGEQLTVSFVTSLREHRKFADLDQLVDQLRHDEKAARHVLAAESRTT